MTAPVPAHTDRLMLTDEAIKSLAYWADAKLGSNVRYYVAAGTNTTDTNGEIPVNFPSPTTLTGCLILPSGFQRAFGQYKDGSSLPPVLPFQLIPRLLTPAGGVWVRAMTAPWQNSPTKWYGSQPVVSGTAIKWFGIGWGPQP